MGRWKRKNRGKRPQKANDPSKYGQERNPYDVVDGGNYKMEAYYAYQGIHDHYYDKESGDFKECANDEEREQERVRFITKLKSILPASFRIGLDVDPTLTESLEAELEEMVGKEMEILMIPKGGERRKERLDLQPEKVLIAPAKKLQYIPHGYQLSLDRQTIRRNPQMSTFHDWLKVQTEAGFISRQETVSMLPPVVLDVKPHHKVLDMCAAPGSKTSQILEVVNLPANPGDTEPTGVVVANDSDSKRAYMLVHQLRRINSPSAFITSCDAQFFPLIRDAEYPTEGIFDRVLCDVPCAGDGTTRKNPGVWKKWNQLNAYGLHTLQLAIALKGARLTKVGGYLCYSTCSMNPIENEAVVAEILRTSDGSLELVDRRSELKGLIARPGMKHWEVLSESRSNRKFRDIQNKNNAKMKARRQEWKKQQENGKKPDSMDVESESKPTDVAEDSTATKLVEETKNETSEVKTEEENKDDPEQTEAKRMGTKIFEPESFSKEYLTTHCESVGLKAYSSYEDVPLDLKKRIRQSSFPPTPEEAEKFHMERAMRILPHDMDTGGFFVALFKKVAPINPKSRERFQELLDSMEAAEKEKAINSNFGGKKSPPSEEPKVKKARIENDEQTNTDAKTDDDVAMVQSATETETTKKVETAGDGDAGAASVVQELAGEKSGDVVRGAVKKNFLKDKDGKAHATLGMDDFITVPSELFDPLVDYFGLSSESFRRENYMMRACGDAKVLYLMGKTVKSLIDQGMQEKITVISSGLKGFVRNKNECQIGYRVSQEGVHLVHPHMTKRKLTVDIDDFRRCLHDGNIIIDTFSDGFAEQVRALSTGSYVVILEGFEKDYLKKLVVVMWKCRGTKFVNCLVNQTDMDGMLTKLRALGFVEPVVEQAIESTDDAQDKEKTLAPEAETIAEIKE